ncbi:hypothetical protein ALUC_10458A [Aspergillus luchuensis]|nr:hypothetical protein ALUC_10458A [Aspergillus luchuensis]
MLGAFRCNNSTSKNLEFIDLSRKVGMDSRNSAVLACEPCRAQKLKCNGDLYGCERCQESSTDCTYRTPTPASSTPLSLKHSTSDLPALPLKRRRTNGVGALRIHCPSPVGPTPRIQSPLVRPEPVLVNSYQDWGQFCNMNTTEHPGLNLTLEDNLPCYPTAPLISEAHLKPSHLVSPATSDSSEVGPSVFVRNPHTPVTSQDPSKNQGQSCKCIQSLADTLERVGGDNDQRSNIDHSERLDYLLTSLHTGVDTCTRVLDCGSCDICATNSMIFMALIQQLAIRSRDLCDLLLSLQDKPQRTLPDDPADLQPEASVFIGRYQIQIEAPRANKMLTEATETSEKASHILEGILVKRAAEKAKNHELYGLITERGP